MSIMISLTTATLVVVATELTIHWNHVEGVNTLSSAGHTIPFAIGAALFARVFYVYFKNPETQEHRFPNTETQENRLPVDPVPPYQFPDYFGSPPSRSRDPLDYWQRGGLPEEAHRSYRERRNSGRQGRSSGRNRS